MTLLWKSIFFLSMILLIQLALFSALSYLWIKAENDQRQLAYSLTVITTLAIIQRSISEAWTDVALYGVTKDASLGKKFDKLCASVPKQLWQLTENPQAKPVDLDQLRVISDKAAYFLHVMQLCKTAAESGAKVGQYGDLIQTLRFDLRPVTDDLLSSINSLSSRHETLRKLQSGQEEGRSNLMHMCLIIAFGANILGTTVTVLWFGQTIARRINNVARNTHRLAAGQTLTPIQPGSDEIAVLDRAFHDMAELLSEASARDRIVFEQMPIGLIACHQEGYILSANPTIQTLLEYSSEELTGKPVVELLETNSKDSYESYLTLTESTNGKLSRLALISKTGKLLQVDVLSAAIQLKGERRTIMCIVDLKDRIEVENLRREFVSVVSHDLRTPLTSINVFLEMLLYGAYGQLDAKGTAAVTSIRKEGARLLQLTSDLLDIAKLEEGQIVLTKGTHDVVNIFELSLNAVDGIAQAKKVELQADAADLSVYGDQARIIQILVNLLSNAIKFSPPNSIVRLSATCEENAVKLSVTDQGRGIAVADQQVIFQRFKQSHQSDAKTGVGLGLSICAMLAQAHGGSVGLDSELGKGSTFWVTLPIENKRRSHEASSESQDTANISDSLTPHS